MNIINRFEGEYAFLSNFYPVEIVDPVDGLVFPTVEHAYQAAKTDDPEWRERIRSADSPSRAKYLGRRCPMMPSFEPVKVPIMHMYLQQKFARPDLAIALALTGIGTPLVEGNTWGDTFWGVCNGIGQNQLGKLLILIRLELMIK